MDPNRKSDRILSEWDAIVHRAGRPASAPRRRRSAAGLIAGMGLAGAGVLAAALIVAIAALGGRISSNVGSSPSTPIASQVAIATVPPSARPTASEAVPPTPTPTPTERPVESSAPPATPACSPDVLTARITAWEGAAGSRIADVTVKNTATVGCDLGEPTTLALVDGAGTTLMSGAGPTGPAIHVASGATVTTLVDASNYCGGAPKAPVTIRFDLGGQRLTADSLSASDTTVPPCNGATVPASLQMQPWSH